ncbi:MAG: polyphosphate kinase 2 [Pseudomonadota bacterium]
MGDKKKSKSGGKHSRKNGAAVEFDLENPKLPRSVASGALVSGNYPYDAKLRRADYEATLRTLQIELVKLQRWVREEKRRVIVLLEGRDAAGKGGTIKAFTENMNPRHTRVVALSKPSDTERGQWYFQRYISHFPTEGEIVLFDRSWYNRAGVERVMGFCTKEEAEDFLDETPRFEGMLRREGITLIKFWLNIGKEMQWKRFHDRRHDPLKIWKLSPIDIASLNKWDDYTEARDRMLERTHAAWAPWTIVKTNDKRRGRLNAIRHVLSQLDYVGKEPGEIGDIDAAILGHGPDYLGSDGE